MLGTYVPEAAVDEHRDTLAREHDVGCAAQRRQRASMHAVSETGCVESRPQRKFGCRLATPLRRHAP